MCIGLYNWGLRENLYGTWKAIASIGKEDNDDKCLARLLSATGILPHDAIHLAVMKRLGLTAIASDDEGFDRHQHQGITLFLP